jgi:hypothetical protein
VAELRAGRKAFTSTRAAASTIAPSPAVTTTTAMEARP